LAPITSGEFLEYTGNNNKVAGEKTKFRDETLIVAKDENSKVSGSSQRELHLFKIAYSTSHEGSFVK